MLLGNSGEEHEGASLALGVELIVGGPLGGAIVDVPIVDFRAA